MSDIKGKIIKYDCGNDHNLGTPCSGHTMQVIWHNTSDTVSIVMDGTSVLVLDDGGFWALLEAAKG